MTGLRRAVLLTGALASVFVTASAAAEDVPEANLAESVRDIPAADGVRDIVIAGAVIPLEDRRQDGGRTVVRISSDVLFDFGEATLTDTARRRIDRLAVEVTGPVRVAGFTDDIGTPAANLRLSRARAQAVRAELSGRVRFPVSATGHGEARPVAPNKKPDGTDDPQGRAENRREEISYQR